MSNLIAHPSLVQQANDLQAETIREQQKTIVELRGLVAIANNRVAKRDGEIARLKDPASLINEALNRPDIQVAFRNPKSIVVSVRKEDDPKSQPIGDYVAYQSDLESVVSDRQFASLLAWFVTVAMGQEVVMEVEE